MSDNLEVYEVSPKGKLEYANCDGVKMESKHTRQDMIAMLQECLYVWED